MERAGVGGRQAGRGPRDLSLEIQRLQNSGSRTPGSTDSCYCGSAWTRYRSPTGPYAREPCNEYHVVRANIRKVLQCDGGAGERASERPMVSPPPFFEASSQAGQLVGQRAGHVDEGREETGSCWQRALEPPESGLGRNQRVAEITLRKAHVRGMVSRAGEFSDRQVLLPPVFLPGSNRSGPLLSPCFASLPRTQITDPSTQLAS
ncbi:hypothetical protein Mp_8g03240 [Marchantia polymorpha subsp. ruderalis]|uniref:Uncharacterized protein n=1 Tax=Marchantia polymorpha TaxID=3197 RepID=A0A2R6XJ83_MARPO|nr:hypothetical protein MARPO_0012s0115 [Marchantia polymorpha]BBN18532.1 hypothetical protein Mp_8g03240 [Marchantia polymorpha subsp. ruderalis]|eukprot:PTQ46174.1 hypothetical protein MARPO_0012s0115 [Marchantia polymorpha]